jgi:hypothetical protein
VSLFNIFRTWLLENGYKTDFDSYEELLRELKKKHKADTNLQLNLGFWGSTSFVALYPMIDLVNHHHPTSDSDAISYQLERSIHRTSLLSMAEHTVPG